MVVSGEHFREHVAQRPPSNLSVALGALRTPSPAAAGQPASESKVGSDRTSESVRSLNFAHRDTLPPPEKHMA